MVAGNEKCCCRFFMVRAFRRNFEQLTAKQFSATGDDVSRGKVVVTHTAIYSFGWDRRLICYGKFGEYFFCFFVEWVDF